MTPPVQAAFHLREGMLLLGAALGFVLVFRRFGLGATLGYLVAGALIGPHGLDLVGDAANKLHFAELGIVLPPLGLLAGIIGPHCMRPEEIRHRPVPAFKS